VAERRFDNEIEEILYHIERGNNFLLSGGAGSGKTFSLVQTLKKLSLLYPTANFACITYTNAAAIEIKNRAQIKNLRVSTIHDFLWDTIAPFQKEMKKTLIELRLLHNSKKCL
jgi:DNA helicase-2/ATP-dependent DNA helicase PcrA